MNRRAEIKTVTWIMAKLKIKSVTWTSTQFLLLYSFFFSLFLLLQLLSSSSWFYSSFTSSLRRSYFWPLPFHASGLSIPSVPFHSMFLVLPFPAYVPFHSMLLFPSILSVPLYSFPINLFLTSSASRFLLTPREAKMNNYFINWNLLPPTPPPAHTLDLFNMQRYCGDVTHAIILHKRLFVCIFNVAIFPQLK